MKTSLVTFPPGSGPHHLYEDLSHHFFSSLRSSSQRIDVSPKKNALQNLEGAPF